MRGTQGNGDKEEAAQAKLAMEESAREAVTTPSVERLGPDVAPDGLHP